MKFINKHQNKFLLLLLIIISITAWYINYRNGLITIYQDSMSHLNISKAVVSGLQPGIAQLGVIWLPLNHLLDLLLVWNNWAWHSGFAGSFWGMISYVLSAIGIYKIIIEITGKKFNAFIGASILVFSLNLLYEQSTPLTEPIFLINFIFSVLYFIRYIKYQRVQDLIYSGLFGGLQCLIRYDGYFATGTEFLLIIFNQYFVRKISFFKALGEGLVMYLPSIAAILLWLLWNFILTRSFLYSFFGAGSAHNQQSLQIQTSLIAKHNLWISLKVYLFDVLDINGIILSILAVIGLVCFFISSKFSVKFWAKVWIFLLLLSPVIFNILALYLGFSIIDVPNITGNFFNNRYGLVALPFIAIFIGTIIIPDINKYIKYIIGIVVLSLLIFQNIIFAQTTGVITITDGLIGKSSLLNSGFQSIARVLHNNVKPGQRVLLPPSSLSPVLFLSGLPENYFITNGIQKYWDASLKTPWKYVDWVVIPTGNNPLYNKLIINRSSLFKDYYYLFYKNLRIIDGGSHVVNVYKLRPEDQTYVTAQHGSLILGNNSFTIKGVNDYDLAYESKAQILSSFQYFKKMGVNTIRFWMFGDGIKDGFQPQAGVMNSNRFSNASYIIYLAGKYNIHLIPVLLNYWSQYGGTIQYLNWAGVNTSTYSDQFYTNPAVTKLFENYIKYVLNYDNAYTGKKYKDSPQILSWEIINEPRVVNSSDMSVAKDWIESIAVYIRSIDSKSLISVGMEDITTPKGGNFGQVTNVCALPAINLCSLHLYFVYQNKPLFNSISALFKFLSDEKNLSLIYHKPIYVGEIGVSKNSNTLLGTNNNLTLLNDTIYELGFFRYNGVIVWDWSLSPNSSFTFTPNGSGGYDWEDLKTLLKSF
jgi:hypothetical protein